MVVESGPTFYIIIPTPLFFFIIIEHYILKSTCGNIWGWAVVKEHLHCRRYFSTYDEGLCWFCSRFIQYSPASYTPLCKANLKWWQWLKMQQTLESDSRYLRIGISQTCIAADLRVLCRSGWCSSSLFNTRKTLIFARKQSASLR